MSVHYKFKSALDFDTITFDGLHINVADLKKAIIHQKRLGKNVDFDLQITNAQTKEEYNEDTVLIPKNTSLIIARIPLAPNAAKRFQNIAQTKNPVPLSGNKGDGETKHVDLAAMDGSETDKINAMMHQSTADYDPTNYQKVRGGGQIGEVPPSYRCHRCHKQGHWIKNCPMGPVQRDIPEIKRSTGIPRSFIERDKNQSTEQTQPVIPEMPKTEVPEELICSICKDLFTDAVMIPCCGSSFCDECVRTALLESEDNECPDCQEKGTSPASLIPNRFLRRSVNNFKNETGYIVPKKQKEERIQEEEVIPEENTESNDFTEEEQNEPVEEQTESTERHASHHSELDMPHEQENRHHERESYPAEMHESSGHHRDSHHYRESDEYSIRTTDPYHRQDNKPDQHQGGEPMRSAQIPSYPMQPMHPYPNQPYGHQGGPPHMNQNFMMRQPYNQHMQGYGRPPFYQHRGYGHGGYPPRNRHAAPPYTDVSTIYQGVAQQVGTGIIDDPLEAFNRIMREKERAKEEQARRRSPLFMNKYRRSRTPDRRRKRRSNSFEGSPIKRHFDRRVIDRKRRRSRSFSSSRSRSRSPPRKRSFTPRKYSKSPIRRSRSISQHNTRPHRNQRRDYRESTDRGVRKEADRAKSPLRPKHKERHKSKTKEIKKKSRSRTPTRIPGKSSKHQTGDRQRRKSRERTPHNDASSKHPPTSKSTTEIPNNINNSMPLEFSDVLPPGVEAFDDESWQTSEKYVAKSNDKAGIHSENQPSNPVVPHETNDKHENDDGESKNASKDKEKDKKVKDKDKKRRKKEKEKEKDVDTNKKNKKHKKEKSDRDTSQEKPKSTEEKTEAKETETHSDIIDMKTKNIATEIERTLTPPLTSITKSDSVLDLYDNIDLDIFGDHTLNTSEDFLTLPEPSKWELEEKSTVPDEITTEPTKRVSIPRELSTRKSSEKQHSKDNSPLSSAIVRPLTLESTTTVHNLKISVPAKATNHSERSIELKSSGKHDKIKSVVSKDGKESKKLSVKDRLGEKVKERSSDRRPVDHSRGSGGKLPSAALRNDGPKNDRDKDKEREKEKERDRGKSSRTHQSSHHHNSGKVDSKTTTSRSSTRASSPSKERKPIIPTASTKPTKRSSSTSSSSSSESNEGDSKSRRSKKEKKTKKKRSSKSSDESNTSLDKKSKKSSKKKSKKEKKKKSKHKS